MAAPIRAINFFRKCCSFSKIKRLSIAAEVGPCLSKATTLASSRNIHCQCVLNRVTPPDEKALKKMMESLTDRFAEARELLNDARESEGTVYFSEDMQEAQTAVQETLNEYQKLLGNLSETQRKDVIAALGLRMEELKAQQAAIEDSLKD